MTTPSTQIDTTVFIPAAVRAASAHADALHKEVYTPAPPDVTQEGNEPPAPEASTSEVQTPEPAHAPEPAPTPTPERKQVDEASWEHRYNSMKGRFDRAEADNRQLSDTVRALQAQLSQMQSELQDMREDDEEPERLITAEEESAYGPDFMEVVSKKAREALLPELRARDKTIAELRAQLGSVGGYVAKTAQQSMHEALDKELPNWRTVNLNADFLSWLKLPDAYSGAIRHDLLKAAYEQNNAPRVLAFFNGFLAEEAAVDPAKRVPDQTAQEGTKIPLETLAAPGRAKTAAATGAPAEKPIITSAQISRFYADIAAGKYRGKETEQAKHEAMIFEAEREGRIR